MKLETQSPSDRHLLTRRVLAAWQRWSEAEDREHVARCLGLSPGEVETLERLEANVGGSRPATSWVTMPDVDDRRNRALWQAHQAALTRFAAGLAWYASAVPQIVRLLHPAALGGQACLLDAFRQMALPDPGRGPGRDLPPRGKRTRALVQLIESSGLDLEAAVSQITLARLADRAGVGLSHAHVVLSRIRKARGICLPSRWEQGGVR